MARGGLAGMGQRGGPAGVDTDDQSGQIFALVASQQVLIGGTSSATTEKLIVNKADSTNNATTNVLALVHSVSGASGAAGIGCGLAFDCEDSGGSLESAAVLRAVLTTATGTAEVGAFRIGVVNASSLPAEASEEFQLSPTLLTTISNDAVTNATTVVRRLRHRTSGTAAAGFGTGIALAGEDAGGGDDDIALLRAVLTTATAGAEVGAFRIGVVNTSVPSEGAEQFQLAPALLTTIADDAVTNATTVVRRLRHRTSGTAAAGFGTGIALAGEDAGGGDDDIALLRAVLTTATAGAEVGAFRIGVVNTSVPSEGAEQFQLAPALLTTIADDAVTNATTVVRRLRHRTSGTAAAGFGTGIALAGEDAGGDDDDIALLRAVLTTATAGAEVGAFRIGVVNTTVPAEGSEQFQLAPALLTLIADDSATNATTTTARLRHRTSGTAAAGFGIGVALAVESAAGTDRDAAVLRTVLTTATDGAEVSSFRIGLIDAGSQPAEASEQHQFQPGSYLGPDILGFTGDADTNFRRAGADTLALRTGGSDRVTVGNSSVQYSIPLQLSAIWGNGGDLTFHGGTGTEIYRISHADSMVKLAAASSAANNAQTVTVGNVGPGGAGISIQSWWQIKDSSGNTRYIPLFG